MEILQSSPESFICMQKQDIFALHKHWNTITMYEGTSLTGGNKVDHPLGLIGADQIVNDIVFTKLQELLVQLI